MAIKKVDLTKNDEAPVYSVVHEDTEGNPQDITSAAIVCSMKNTKTGELKIDRQSIGITITDATNGAFEYAWQTGETDTPGKYQIEFEITPASGGKFTIPNPTQGKALVEIHDSMDAS